MLLSAAAAVGALALGLGTTAVVAPAQAAGMVTTDYGFQGHAYGTRITSAGTGVSSARSAFAYIACTRSAGRTDEERLASLALPAQSPYVTVDSVLSGTRTFRDPSRHIAAAIESSSRIGHVQLGDSSTPRLVFDDLATTSRAWATTGGALKARNTFTAGTLRLENPPTGLPPELQGPLDDLTGALGEGIDQVLDALQQNGGTIVIPGLGEVSTGFDKVRHTSRWSSGSAIVLRVLLYGPDGGNDSTTHGSDDSRVNIGTSWARINTDVTGGVMSGVGYGARSELVDGTVSVGKAGEQNLPCQGTRGKVLSAPTAGLAPPGSPFSVATARGRSFGVQKDSGAARAWTEGSVADLTLGSLTISGIQGRVNVKQDRHGRMVEKSFRGSAIADIVVDGESQGGIKPGQTAQIPAGQLPPEVAKIEFFKRHKSKRGASISAVVITFADGTPGASTLELGTARASIKRH